jgi:hypothetical protein
MTGFSHSTRVLVRDCPHTPAHEYKDRATCRAQRYAERKQTGRFKAVVDSSEVAHLWAHKVQSHARNARKTVFFSHDTIYSYGEHFPIARHVTNKAGEQAVLFTTAHYSVTTSQHCGMVRSAISHLTVFSVPHVVGRWNTEVNHGDNLKAYADAISTHLLKAARARTSKEWEHARALELHEEAIKYAKFFRVPYAKTLPAVPALDSVQLQAIKDAENKRLAAERKRIMRENAEAIALWRTGEYARLPHGLPDMLRVSKDGQSIETSRGVSFPISHAKRGLALVRAVRNSGETWHTNGHTCQLGHYRIDSIQSDGTVKAGCHTVKYSEIERIAPAIDAAPTVLESLETSQAN